MKKLFVIMIAMLMVLSPVFANGNKESAPVQDGPETIVWAGWSGEEEASKDIFQKMMGRYESASGNDINWVGFTWADTVQQILIRLQGGEQLDIAQVDIGMFNTLAQTGMLQDLNEIFTAEELSNFQTSALNVGLVDGQQLALPWSMASISMVYNPEILKEAGWDRIPATIAEFEQCCADIVALGKGYIPYGVSTKDGTAAGDFMPWLWTFGTSIFNSDGSVNLGPEAVTTIKWYQDMLSKGYIQMDVGRGNARQLFAQGKMAFYDDAVVAKGQAVKNGVAPEKVVDVCSAMPRPVLNAGDEPQSTMWGHMLVIFKNSTHKEAAHDFALSLNEDEMSIEYFLKNGMPPATISAGNTDTVKNDPYINGFIESTVTAKLDETARMSNASEIKSVVVEELQAALLGKKTAEQSVESMRSRISSL